jgi:hypothetical protein
VIERMIFAALITAYDWVMTNLAVIVVLAALGSFLWVGGSSIIREGREERQ